MNPRKGSAKLFAALAGLVLVGIFGVVWSLARAPMSQSGATPTTLPAVTSPPAAASTPVEETSDLPTEVEPPVFDYQPAAASGSDASATPTLLRRTATPTELPPTSTPALPCNQLSSLKDVTISPGTQVVAEQSFVKTWSFHNSGSCTWTKDYVLARTSGSLLVPYERVSLGGDILPGTGGQISIDVTAPLAVGDYTDTWQLFDKNGNPMTDQNGRVVIFAISVTVIPPTSTPVPPASISGRITKDGGPPGAGITLSLENLANQQVASAVTSADGTFNWSGVPASDQGYNIVFSQAANDQYGIQAVATWVWVGPIPVRDGDVIQVPDIDISLLGFKPGSPAPDSAYSAAAITLDTPLLFQWTVYPGASYYWADLVRGEAQVIAWQSSLVPAPSTAFGGTLLDGTRIQPGEYWWAAGAVRGLGPYTQTVYTFLAGFSMEE